MKEDVKGVNETLMGGFTIAIPRWNITEMNGYKPKTTFWEDFSIADAFGVDAVKDTFERAFKEWKDNVVYLTELCLVLNHKCNIYYCENKKALYETYYNLYVRASDYAEVNLEGKDYKYYFRWTD